MKKTLKVLICFILMTVLSAGSLAFALSYKAVEPTFDVLVNGERFYSDPPVIVIEGRTYLPLRAMGDCLGVYVEWNSQKSQVEVSTTKEATPKQPEVKDSYERFTDVPDFGKLTNLSPSAEEELPTDIGYMSSYGYEIPVDNLSSAISSYLEQLLVAGYEEYFYDDSQGYETILLFREESGRMINLVLLENKLVVSVMEKKHTSDEWIALDSGQALPAKEFDAVTAGFKVLVDNKEFVSENPALVVDGRTYLPLRAMGDCLGVDVEWNSEKGQVEVTK